jgi:hypothetical protein
MERRQGPAESDRYPAQVGCGSNQGVGADPIWPDVAIAVCLLSRGGRMDENSGRFQEGWRGGLGRPSCKAQEVHASESALSVSVALLGRLSKPGRCNRIVPRDAPAVVVGKPKRVLSTGIALVSRLSEPANRSSHSPVGHRCHRAAASAAFNTLIHSFIGLSSAVSRRPGAQARQVSTVVSNTV